eukprot:12036278-Karenia_brevis.AAC.1
MGANRIAPAPDGPGFPRDAPSNLMICASVSACPEGVPSSGEVGSYRKVSSPMPALPEFVSSSC